MPAPMRGHIAPPIRHEESTYRQVSYSGEPFVADAVVSGIELYRGRGKICPKWSISEIMSGFQVWLLCGITPSPVRKPLCVQGEDNCHGWPQSDLSPNLPRWLLGRSSGRSAPKDGTSSFRATITIGAAGPRTPRLEPGATWPPCGSIGPTGPSLAETLGGGKFLPGG